jgi:phosphoglycerate kinase
MLHKLTVRDLSDDEIDGRRALVRVDYNVPLDDEGRVTDDVRIRSTIPTLEYLRGRGASMVLMSHLGRPKGRDPAFSLRPVADRLTELLGREVIFLEGDDSIVGPEVGEAAKGLEPGAVMLLENTRFETGETKNDESLSRSFAALGEVFVNDAFAAAHRAHASTAGVARYLEPAVAGLLLERELLHLGELLERPEKPFVVVLGGAKVSGKIDLIENLLPRLDRLCVGGAMACTFYRAMDLSVGASLVEADLVEVARALLERAGEKLVLPDDVVVARELERDAETRVVDRDAIPDGWMVADIGPKSAKTFTGAIEGAETVLWNGPVGVFELEPFASGSHSIARGVAEATRRGATTVVGGGDTASAVAGLGLAGQMTHISTGGGATLEFLAGKELPGVAALTGRDDR